MSYFIPPHVRSIRSEGGLVLLNLSSGAYFTLNAVGALVWDELQGGATREAALAAMGRRFPAVPEERLAGDLDPLLARLLDKGLLARGAGSSRALARGTTRADPRLRSGQGPTTAATVTAKAPWGWSVLAYLVLIGMDVLLHFAGFARFHRVVSGWTTRARGAVDPASAARIVAAVDAAAALYFKRAWCLQRSATTACLLRLRGFPAELVIGVRRVPFMAHAWVEVGDQVVNDSDRVLAFHEIIERC